MSEVGQVPGSMPPIVIVRFEPSQTAAEAVVQAAKEGLESDPFNTTPVAVTLTHTPVQAPAALAPIVRFTATDLWVRLLGENALRLNTELFDCGTCINQVVQVLQRTPGVLEARPDRSPGGTVVLVTFDPSVISREALAAVANEALEADPLLPVTVAIHFFSPDEGQAAP